MLFSSSMYVLEPPPLQLILLDLVTVMILRKYYTFTILVCVRGKRR